MAQKKKKKLEIIKKEREDIGRKYLEVLQNMINAKPILAVSQEKYIAQLTDMFEMMKKSDQELRDIAAIINEAALEQMKKE